MKIALLNLPAVEAMDPYFLPSDNMGMDILGASPLVRAAVLRGIGYTFPQRELPYIGWQGLPSTEEDRLRVKEILTDRAKAILGDLKEEGLVPYGKVEDVKVDGSRVTVNFSLQLDIMEEGND